MPRIGGTGPKRPAARSGKTGKMLFLEECAVFGQCISAVRNSLDPSKISAVTNWPNVNKCVQLEVCFRIYHLVQF